MSEQVFKPNDEIYQTPLNVPLSELVVGVVFVCEESGNHISNKTPVFPSVQQSHHEEQIPSVQVSINDGSQIEELPKKSE